ncbi:MAG: SHOCT domain-containing protein [Acidimicrobiales bacterium]|nr:SHOCT domain-containing protein [Acidimicrobiales bacterium]
MLVAATWGTGQVLLDMLWFFLFIIEIWLMISIFIDVFRRHDMKGWLKALWVLIVILVPLVGIVLYLILYGDEMRVHARQAADQQARAFREYVRETAGTYSPSDEIARLADLRDRGVINEEEYARLKERVVSGQSA